MSPRLRPARSARRAFAWAVAWLFAAALYLLLIDITDLPELIVGAVAAVLAAIGTELAREQEVAGESVRVRWLARVHRPLLKVPGDILFVSLEALRALLRRQGPVGVFRVAPFASGEPEDPRESGRRALAEALGSFAPNTIVVGIDRDRDLILAHQLHRTGGREAIDPLELGRS